MNQKDMSMVKTEEQMESQANAATKMLSGTVRRLMDDGVEPAALAEALASALGVMLAAAPRSMAENVTAAIFEQVREQMRATWSEIDAAESVH